MSRQHTGSWLNRIKPAQRWVMGSATGLYVPPPPPHSPCRSTAASSPPLSQDNVPWPEPPSQMNIHYHSFVQIFSWILLPPHPPPAPSLFPWPARLAERKRGSGKRSRSAYGGVTGSNITPQGLKRLCTIFCFICVTLFTIDTMQLLKKSILKHIPQHH